MFEDQRSQKVILVSHCLLNQNSISDGTADHSGVFNEIIEELVKSGVGILQMPCPELLCLGLDRGDRDGGKRHVLEENSRIRRNLLTDENQKVIANLVDGVVLQVNEYLKNGFTIQAIIGVNRSPSCGVETTSQNNAEVDGKGVFIQRLLRKLHSEVISLPVVGVKTSMPEEAQRVVKTLLD